jgi:hypothetical protein
MLIPDEILVSCLLTCQLFSFYWQDSEECFCGGGGGGGGAKKQPLNLFLNLTDKTRQTYQKFFFDENKC